jgi:hypothetical protein
MDGYGAGTQTACYASAPNQKTHRYEAPVYPVPDEDRSKLCAVLQCRGGYTSSFVSALATHSCNDRIRCPGHIQSPCGTTRLEDRFGIHETPRINCKTRLRIAPRCWTINHAPNARPLNMLSRISLSSVSAIGALTGSRYAARRSLSSLAKLRCNVW